MFPLIEMALPSLCIWKAPTCPLKAVIFSRKALLPSLRYVLKSPTLLATSIPFTCFHDIAHSNAFATVYVLYQSVYYYSLYRSTMPVQ